MIPLF